MGLFGKKKPKKVKETLLTNLIIELKKHDKEVENYKRMKLNIHKFIDAYKSQLTTSAYMHSSGVTLYLRGEYYNEYPDGFFAFADKLGLTVEPNCSNGYSYSGNERPVIVRAKNK